jgi:hypothetical protein
MELPRRCGRCSSDGLRAAASLLCALTHNCAPVHCNRFGRGARYCQIAPRMPAGFVQNTIEKAR